MPEGRNPPIITNSAKEGFSAAVPMKVTTPYGSTHASASQKDPIQVLFHLLREGFLPYCYLSGSAFTSITACLKELV